MKEIELPLRQSGLCLYGRKLYPIHPNISKHTLHTVLYTFPRVLTRRVC